MFTAAFSEKTYLCSRCEPESKRPANDSSEFGVPLLRIDDVDDEAPVKAVTMQSRLIALEKKIDVITKLLETLASNLPPDRGENPGAGL